MKRQLTLPHAVSVAVLGAAGGNGFEHIEPCRVRCVYAVDINEHYLEACMKRHARLGKTLIPVEMDLSDPKCSPPPADLYIADLFIEYIGIGQFTHILVQAKPRYVSCVIQESRSGSFVSDSPYTKALSGLAPIHQDIGPADLTQAMTQIGYWKTGLNAYELPNGKKLIQLDFKRIEKRGIPVFSFDDVLSGLNERGFIAHGFHTPEEAADAALALIRPDESVGFGGSVTVRDLGLYDRLKERGNPVFWHWFDKAPDTRKKALLADVYLTSTNALTAGGELVNTDGGGNRVAAMFYGPDRCIVIAGKNKIVPGYNEALTRIKTVACPQNARRLGLDTPCSKTGYCGECDKSLRMCRVTVRYSYPAPGRETHVFIVDRDLGF